MLTKFKDAFADTVVEKNIDDGVGHVKIGSTCRFFITWLYSFKDASVGITVENINKIMLVESSIAV